MLGGACSYNHYSGDQPAGVPVQYRAAHRAARADHKARKAGHRGHVLDSHPVMAAEGAGAGAVAGAVVVVVAATAAAAAAGSRGTVGKRNIAGAAGKAAEVHGMDWPSDCSVRCE